MKPTKYIVSILILSMIIVSCRKDYPCLENDAGEFTNKFILTNIKAKINSEKDTAKYNEFYININLSGEMISENVACMTDNPYRLGEQRYFINNIVSFSVTPNCVYNDSINNYRNISILLSHKIRSYSKENFGLDYPQIGYTPVKIKITAPPDTSKWVSFTVKITDNKNNVFMASTDSLFITK